MRLKSRIFAIGLASAALVASGTAFAQYGGDNSAAAFCGRAVVGANGELLGQINQTQEGSNGDGQLYLYTTSNVGLKGKVVVLPQTMFAGQESEPGYMVLKAPKLTIDELRKMPAVEGAASTGAT